MRAFASAVGASEQVVAAADGDTARGPLSGRVVDLDHAVVAVAQQRRPQVHGVLDLARAHSIVKEVDDMRARFANRLVEEWFDVCC